MFRIPIGLWRVLSKLTQLCFIAIPVDADQYAFDQQPGAGVSVSTTDSDSVKHATAPGWTV